MSRPDTPSDKRDGSHTLLQFIQQNERLRSAISCDKVIEFCVRDAAEVDAPIMPHIISVGLDPGDFAATLEHVENGLQCIILRNALNSIGDYRTFLADIFQKLAVFGNLVIVVPNQFLYERKLQPPSRLITKHTKFYTPAQLLAEIEESIDPFQYRLRFISDNDFGYDYNVPLSQPPIGSHDIVACLQKITVPAWRDQVEKIDCPTRPANKPTRFLRPGKDAPYYVVSTQIKKSQTIIILKLDHRGDFILAESAFRVIRNSFPDARITLCCGTWNVGAAQELDLFDEVLQFDFFSEDGSAVLERTSVAELHERFRKLLAGKEYDLAVDLRIFEETRPLLQLINAKSRAGFDPYDTFPWIDIRLNIATPTGEGRPEQGLMPASEFEFLEGCAAHRGYDIIVDTPKKSVPQQPLVWGPYRRLKPGHYSFDIILEPMRGKDDLLTRLCLRPTRRVVSKIYGAFAEDPLIDTELAYDLCCDSGDRMLQFGQFKISKSAHPRLFFQSSETIDGFEFRLLPAGNIAPPRCRFLGVRYTRYAALTGVHQSEFMALLAHLIALRMRFPFQVTQHAD
jgi:hypothetical protein